MLKHATHIKMYINSFGVCFVLLRALMFARMLGIIATRLGFLLLLLLLLVRCDYWSSLLAPNAMP